ncbi:hypothetical protein HDV01_005589 [Terramyces sp. JEL0728]|nr:hypothetical protein HDV01_005589 [Terramyces sp. JEL0728]
MAASTTFQSETKLKHQMHYRNAKSNKSKKSFKRKHEDEKSEDKEIQLVPCVEGNLENQKRVTFNPAHNNTRLFKRKDTPLSIAREYKNKPQPPEFKPILKVCEYFE